MGFGEENRWWLSFPGSAGVIKSKHILKYVLNLNNFNLPTFIGSSAKNNNIKKELRS
jgi:hypothetical protein